MPKRLVPGREKGTLMLSGFQVSKTKGISFKEHIEKGLADFLGKRDYPVLTETSCPHSRRQGIFAEKEAKDFNIKGFDEKVLVAPKGRK